MNRSPDDILLNKAGIIERCLKRIREEHRACPKLDNYTHLDAIILNLERACQACIDMANHIVAENHLGIPQNTAESFELLQKAGIIDESHAKAMKGMVGFRNIAIHEYQHLNLEVIRYVINIGWQDMVKFCERLGISIQS